MGAYLSHPITEKSSSDNRDNRLKCGASSMQGWRVSQEDAHNCILDFDKDTSLFAVYDGHGGKEVAEYAAETLPDIIKTIDNYKTGNYSEALKEAFLKFDKMLIEPSVMEKLKIIAKDETSGKGKDEAEDDMEDDNIGDLREEATMPLEQLMAKYRKGRLGEKEDSPASPFLRGKATSSTADSSSNAVNVSSSSSSSSSFARKFLCSSSSSSSGEGSSNQDVSSSRSDEKPKISSTCEEPCSSSSSASHTRKSLEEKYCNGDVSTSQEDNVVTNGECEKADDNVSSSVDNGSEALQIKMRKIKAALVSSLVSDCGIDSSDSDESFAEGDSSSSEDYDADGAKADDNGEGEGDDDEEDDDDDDDDDDEDDDDDDGEDDDNDDEFTMKMTEDLADALKEGRLVQDYDRTVTEDDNDSSEDGIGPGFLIQALKKRTPGADSGCTAVVALVLKDRVLVANAGDSRCVACRGGKAVDLSVDHKPEDAAELSRIVKAGGKVTSDGRVNGGLNLSRALGDHVYKKVDNLPLEEQMISPLPDIQEIKVTNDIEFIILACDGIWNYMSSQEVVDFVRPRLQKKPAQLSTICEEIFDHCLAPNTMGDGTGCDNMTAVIVQFESEPGTDGDSSKRRAEDDAKDIKENKRTKTETPEDNEKKTETSNLPSTAL